MGNISTQLKSVTNKCLWGVVVMFTSSGWQSKIALLITLGMTSTVASPVLMGAPALADSKTDVVGQLFAQSERFVIPAGTEIPVKYDEAKKIVVTPNEKVPVTLTVAANIRSNSGALLIPINSKIVGNLQPSGVGTQFVAQELRFANSNRRVPIDATSQVFTDRETIKKGSDATRILKGAAIGAAASAVIAEIFGGIDVGEVLGGAGIGALAGLLLGGKKEVEVIVVRPEDLRLTLQSDFAS